MHPPGTKAREPAPTSRGRRMVFTSERSRARREGNRGAAGVQQPAQHEGHGEDARQVGAHRQQQRQRCVAAHGLRRTGQRQTSHLGRVQESHSSPRQGRLGPKRGRAAHGGQSARHTGQNLLAVR